MYLHTGAAHPRKCPCPPSRAVVVVSGVVRSERIIGVVGINEGVRVEFGIDERRCSHKRALQHEREVAKQGDARADADMAA